MGIILDPRDRLPRGAPDMDNLLKRRVAEGINDINLKRGLHRINEERSFLTSMSLGSMPKNG